MRIVKLNEELLETTPEDYFNNVLLNREPPGLFIFPKGWIAAEGLNIGETILFSYEGRVRYCAVAASGRIPNSGTRSAEYPYGFIIDMQSLRPLNISLVDLQDKLGSDKNITVQGWPTIAEDKRVRKIIDEL